MVVQCNGYRLNGIAESDRFRSGKDVLFSALDLVALVLQGVNVNREDRVYE